jgi:hypothetical protein
MAIRQKAIILTNEHDDIERLAEAAGHDVAVVAF